MSEVMTATFWNNQAKMFAEDAGLFLVTIMHKDLLQPLRIASNNVDVTSRGNVFLGWPLAPKWPSKSEGNKRASIIFQNVDPVIGKTLRGLKTKPEVLFEYVSRDNPDELIYDHGGLFLSATDSDDLLVSNELVGFGSESTSFPKPSATPTRTPGLFVL
jgi:hypothetical protein